MQLLSFRDTVRNRAKTLVELLYPVHCLVCMQPMAGPMRICPACRGEALPLRPERRCPRCARPDCDPRELCGRCQRHPPGFRAVHAPGAYRDPLAAWIRELKYGGQLGLVATLAAVAEEGLGDWLTAHGCDLLVPVPLHPDRLAERGFNQALLLARHLGRRHRLPTRAGALRRTRPTPPQVGLADRHRAANVRNAFIASARRVAGRRIALVDDVVTTGATADAATRSLLEAGAESVGIIAVARA
ncbi:ComF family protein [Thiohalorhabdus sp. Cl-TMA]|uniref:ComF family protein n=1 Tax=Thiohalorhabdus methylotrophus TaxID=3242694 RepID=A0ABV4TQM5_9GAMM